MSRGWRDVTLSVRSGMIRWPGDPEILVKHPLSIASGDICNFSTLSLGAHTGTHVDAPRHFIEGGASIDEMPVEAMMGPCRVIVSGNPLKVTRGELARRRIAPGERILLKTRNSSAGYRRFRKDHVSLSMDAAEFLAARGIRVVGIDHLSIGGCHEEGPEVHRILLGAGVWIIEGLNLSTVRAGHYDMICLPLRIADGDGAPARVMLRARPGSRDGRIRGRSRSGCGA